MKGIIFNLLEEVVTTQVHDAAWDEMLDDTGNDGAYTSLGKYSDGEFMALLDVLSERTGKSRHELLRWFGRHAMPFLAHRYPDFFTGHSRLRPFLLTLNDIIHSEVRKLYPGADVPVFEFETPAGPAGGGTLLIHYRSARQLCFLAEGFIQGAADHYSEEVLVRQVRCMLEGADECALLCSFKG